MNILFTSVGNLAFPLVYNELKVRNKIDIRIIGTDIRKSAHGFYFCDKSYITNSRSNEVGFLYDILSIIEAETIDYLFPLSTEDQLFFSKYRSEFINKGVRLICSSLESIQMVNDKYNLYELASEFNLQPTLYTKIEVDLIINEEKIPFVIKKKSSTGGQGTYIVAKDSSHLRKDDYKFFISIEEYKGKEKFYFNEATCIFTEYLNGEEFSVDILCYEGNFIYGCVRERFKSVGGLALESKTICCPKLIELSKLLIDKARLSYIVNIQFKLSLNNQYKVIDINPRIPGTLTLSCSAGGNFILDALNLSDGIFPVNLPTFEDNLFYFRYWSGIVVKDIEYNSILKV